MNLNGKDYVFQRANGDAEWQNLDFANHFFDDHPPGITYCLNI